MTSAVFVIVLLGDHWAAARYTSLLGQKCEPLQKHGYASIIFNRPQPPVFLTSL